MATRRKPVTPPVVPAEQVAIAPSANGTAEVERAAQQAVRQEYLDLRKHFMEHEQAGYDSFDKAILALSTSAFTVSLALVQFMSSTREHSWLIGGAWLCWILAMLATLISFLFSPLAFRRQIEMLDEAYYPGQASPPKENLHDRITNFLNWASAALFIVGAACMAIFGYFNLPA